MWLSPPNRLRALPDRIEDPKSRRAALRGESRNRHNAVRVTFLDASHTPTGSFLAD